MRERISIDIWQKIGRFEIIKELPIYVGKLWNKKRKVIARCNCWNDSELFLWDLLYWNTTKCKSCASTTHWLTNSKIYSIFSQIKQRCNNNRNKAYNDYWGRGIRCIWETFEEFYKDMWWPYKEWLSIERRENNWNYCKDNCYWATIEQQSLNKRNSLPLYKWKSLKEWSKITWINYRTILSRINQSWWSIEKAVNTKIIK